MRGRIVAVEVIGPDGRPPSFPRLMLAAFDAGRVAAADPRRDRASNPHTGDEPGELALHQRWLEGFNSVRLARWSGRT